MGLADQNLSKRNHPIRTDAIQLFTDREDPQEAFERKLSLVSMLKNDASGVICYYGIGGVGKTSLMNKLCHLLDGDDSCKWVFAETNCDYVTFDFSEGQVVSDSNQMLISIMKQLKVKKYEFHILDYLFIRYAALNGTDYKDAEPSMLERNPLASSIVSILGAIPGLSSASNAFQALDSAVKHCRKRIEEKDRIKFYAAELDAIDKMTSNEIMNAIPYYFILDMRRNMLEKEKPLVIFIDTYERYVDTLNSDTLKINTDHWLWKGEDSVIRSIPGILWVIMGRDKLNWPEGDDVFWKTPTVEKPLNEMSESEKNNLAQENIEQHLLGDLSEPDAILFMSKAGIKDDLLCHGLYELTKGMPLYIDLCIKQFRTISEQRKPVLSDFGHDISDLVTRLLRNMPEYYKELSYFLAILGTWNDEMVYDLVPKISSIKGFTKERYKDYLEHSFVISNLDGTRCFHNIVRLAYLKNSGEDLTADVNHNLREWLVNKLHKSNSSTSTLYIYSMLINNLVLFETSYSKLNYLWSIIRKIYDKILERYDYNGFISVSSIFYNHIIKHFPDTMLEKKVVAQYAKVLCKNDDLTQAKQLVIDCFGDNTVSFKDVKKSDLQLLSDLENVYFCLNIPQMEYEYKKQIFDFVFSGNYSNEVLKYLIHLKSCEWFIRKCDEDMVKSQGEIISSISIDSLNEEKITEGLSRLCNRFDNYSAPNLVREKKDVFENAYDYASQILGPNHICTIVIGYSLANIFTSLHEYEKAIKVYEKVFPSTKTLFGNTHSFVLERTNVLSELKLIYEDSLEDFDETDIKSIFEEIRLEYIREKEEAKKSSNTPT